MQNASPVDIAVLAVELVPAVLLGFAGKRAAEICAPWPAALRTFLPLVCVAP
jgi:hypothetical protein